MQIKNTRDRFGIVSISLHWIIALLIIGMLFVGLYMADLPKGPEKLKFYGWHKEFGMLILALLMMRLTWRLSNVTPTLNIPRWERIAARAAHWALYVLMFAMPITGWLVTSAAGLPVSFFGLFVIPVLIEPNKELKHVFAILHEYIAYGLIAVICLHVAAALKHEFIDKDDILRRML
jgi:cytochrome b561